MSPPATPCLVGCTGSGKTDVGIAAARLVPGEVICCDAYTVYRGMPILTAAPTPPSDVPHHLLGILQPYDTYDAARFLVDADHAIEVIHEHGKTPWIVGGTALYLRCWLKGFGTKVPTDHAYREELKARVAEEGHEVLHAELTEKDPERASELHPNDLRRVVRALEIIRHTGKPASEQRYDWGGPDRVPAKIAGLRRPFEELDDRIERRTQQMFDAGLVDEVKEVLTQQLSPQARKTLGLEEVRKLLEGEMTEQEAKEKIIQRTKRFARKQMTFFKSFEQLVWVDVDESEDAETTAQRVVEAVGLG